MKRLSISLPAIALALVLILSGATTAHNATATTPAPSKDNARFSPSYYWYTYPGDSFVDYESIAVEEWEYWFYYGWVVDTNSGGGTLISKGYTLPGTPHSFPPSVFLYRH